MKILSFIRMKNIFNNIFYIHLKEKYFNNIIFVFVPFLFSVLSFENFGIERVLQKNWETSHQKKKTDCYKSKYLTINSQDKQTSEKSVLSGDFAQKLCYCWRMLTKIEEIFEFVAEKLSRMRLPSREKRTE